VEPGKHPHVKSHLLVEHVGCKPDQIAASEEVDQPGDLEGQDAHRHRRIDKPVARPQRNQNREQRDIGKSEEVARAVLVPMTGISTATKAVTGSVAHKG
jgi:hypothetical protein